MKGDRIHVVELLPGNVQQGIGDEAAVGAGAIYMIDLPNALSERFGRNLPACAVYDVTRVRVQIIPQSTANEDTGVMFRGRLSWCEPTNGRVKALKWAANEFFRERQAQYGRQARLQFYPKIAPFTFLTELHLSKRNDDGKFYSLTGASDGSHYAIAEDYNLQRPRPPTPASRPGAEAQATELYDERVESAMETIVSWQAGYGIGVRERFANNATGPENAATPYLTTATEDPNVWVHHSRGPEYMTDFVLEAGPLRSYPWLLGQALFTVESAWPRREAGMWAGTEAAEVVIGVELVGWSELR